MIKYVTIFTVTKYIICSRTQEVLTYCRILLDEHASPQTPCIINADGGDLALLQTVLVGGIYPYFRLSEYDRT